MEPSCLFGKRGEVRGVPVSYTRFAIYYVPPEGALADFGAVWLGWDCIAGCDAVQLDVPGLEDVTKAPRKYGFHGTLKPPFRLADGTDLTGLTAATADMARACAPGHSDGLVLTVLGRFLALTPVGDMNGIARLASTCVKALDSFRAPPTEAELMRRRKARLSHRQDTLLERWGYPYVMEEFRFHLTLTGRLRVEQIDLWTDVVGAHLPELPKPFTLDQIALVGERPEGRFELIERYTLLG